MAKKGTTKTSAASEAAAPAPVKDESAPAAPVAAPKKTRASASSIPDIIQLIRDNKPEKAIAALEKLSKTMMVKKERKTRGPTPFNLFVKEKMQELKDSGLSTNERMKECARLWKEKQQAKSK